MKRVIIICEGETEREFCQNVLASHLIHHSIFIQAPLIKRSMGGTVKWIILKKEIETHLREPNVIVSTFIDYTVCIRSKISPIGQTEKKLQIKMNEWIFWKMQ